MKDKKTLLTKNELSNVTAGDNEPAPIYCIYWRTCPYFDPRLCIVSGGIEGETSLCADK